MMITWLKENLPSSKLEPLAPSESSGFVTGYFGAIRINLNEADLQFYCDQWENSDGTSKDTRVCC